MKKPTTTLKVYSAAQKLYPKKFQSDYSKVQIQTLSDLLDHTNSSGDRFKVWARVWADLAASILVEQINYQGTTLMNETPKFLKTASLISGLMLVPFIVALFADGLSKVLDHRVAGVSWAMQFPLVALSVFVWLPEAALLLAFASFTVYLVRGKANWPSRLSDIRHTWIIVVPGVMAVGILGLLAFHDSFQCVSPSHLFGHSTNIVRCVINNDSLNGFRKFY